MDVNAYPPGDLPVGRSGGHRHRVEPHSAYSNKALMGCTPIPVFGPVTGHDGSGAPLPPAGPYDFSAAQRVHDGESANGPAAAVRLSMSSAGPPAQYVVRPYPSAASAVQAWLASRLCGALGLATPTAILVRGCSLVVDGTHDPERLYLATPFLPAYETLGCWLEGDAAWRVIDGVPGGACPAYRQARAEARELGRRVARLGVEVGPQTGTSADALAAARQALNAHRAVLYGALPHVYQCALERHRLAAMWLDNREICDGDMGNLGIWRDRNDLPYAMTVDFTGCLGTAATPSGIVDGVVHGEAETTVPSDVTTAADAPASAPHFPRGGASAVLGRRLGELRVADWANSMPDALRDPVGVYALAAEMAYRLGRIGAPDILPWAEIVRALPASLGDDGRSEAPHAQVDRILARRDSLVALLGGAKAAQTWARMYPTRAAAISAQQSPFLASGRHSRTS